MRKRQDDWSSMSFGELPAHLGIASTLHTLRVRLDAPADLALTQWQLAPLHTISPRLTGSPGRSSAAWSPSPMTRQHTRSWTIPITLNPSASVAVAHVAIAPAALQRSPLASHEGAIL